MQDAKYRQKFTICAPSHNCRAISSQLRHISTIGKKLVKQQYLLHMSPQCAERRPTNGWDLLASLGHTCKFQRLARLGRVTAQHSGSGHQRNFAASNRGRHLYSARRPSRWALAHISSCMYILIFSCTHTLSCIYYLCFALWFVILLYNIIINY